MRYMNESIEEYGERVQEMHDAELCSELRYYTRPTWNERGQVSLRDVAEGTVLQVVMDSYRKGKSHVL